MALSGDVKALVQANNGNVLAGTNSSAKIYRSTDNGQTWTLITSLGVASDSVNAFAKVNSSGYILAAVSGSSTGSGIWRSTDNGSTWTRVKTHPDGTGYLDITAIQGGPKLVAVGYAVTNPINSPVIHSNDQGSNWIDISLSYYNQPYLAVASYGDGILATQYPGETTGGVFAFYGTDTYYTQLGGVVESVSPSAAGFSTVGGGAGNGGLDMASFLFAADSGRFYRKTLWAVKSAADITDTEIWQWPASSTGPYSFAKIATIDAENFRGLYVDTTPNYTAALRTIWAGGNGSIWVSYNSGLSWAVATTAPVGQIYSFVRTTSGVLIAGGAAGEIFLFSGSGSEGGGSGGGDEEEPPAPPEGSDVITAQILGREATCENEVYTANKFSFSNVTHILHYDGSLYSELQFASSPPYSFLGTSAVVNKVAYFGSKTTDANVPSGPFSSLVFDISQQALNLTIVWEYWNGSAWSDLTVQDNTDRFRNLGVNSVSWSIPTNWATTVVNSVTGYWVRARISAVAAGSQTPIHANRFIYTTLLPYIDIAEEDVKGDLPAVGRIRWTNQASLEVERFICGLRSLDRGTNFNSFINISDVQTPFGLTITKGTQAGVSWQTDKKAPTGRSLLISQSSSGDLNSWKDLVSVTISTTVARDYHGYYRAFLRCFYNNALAQAWNLRLQLLIGSGGSKVTTQTAYPTTLADWEVVDLGQIAISTRQTAFQAGSLSDQLKLVVQGYNTSTLKPLTLYDLILIPIDEWAVDSRIPDLITSGTPQIATHSYMDLDSITNPKVSISAMNRNSAGLIVSRYQTINNGPVIFQKNKDQRLWFFNMDYANYWRGYPELIGSVQVYKQQQYLGFRGDN